MLANITSRSLRIKIYQIYYSPQQRDLIQEGFTPYHNPRANRYLENQVMLDCHQNGSFKDCDFFGVTSWRFADKTGKNIQSISKFISRDGGRKEAYGFFIAEDNVQQHFKSHNMWKHAVDKWHPPLFIEIAQKIFDELKLGVNILDLRMPIIYSNYWIARPEIFHRYVSELLLPSIRVMEENRAIRRLCYENSAYHTLFKRPDIQKATKRNKPISFLERIRIFGRPYFTYHPFICERLFSSWLAMNPKIRFKFI